MRWNRLTKPPMVILAATLMVAVALAGCMQTNGEMSFDSYEEAKSAPGETYAPNNESDGDRFMLKLLKPEDPQNAESGEQPFVILVYDQESDMPVTDAEVEHESRHPSMGHGGGDEQMPTHNGHGVYEGTINPSMQGEWVVNVAVFPEDGEAHRFQIDYRV